MRINVLKEMYFKEATSKNKAIAANKFLKITYFSNEILKFGLVQIKRIAKNKMEKRDRKNIISKASILLINNFVIQSFVLYNRTDIII